jgi:hypothetical protein
MKKNLFRSLWVLCIFPLFDFVLQHLKSSEALVFLTPAAAGLDPVFVFGGSVLFFVSAENCSQFRFPARFGRQAIFFLRFFVAARSIYSVLLGPRSAFVFGSHANTR